LPQAVAEKDTKFVDTWVEGINAYKNAKSTSSANPQKVA